MSVSYFALGDKLSDTDPISNSVLISGLNFARDGANLLLAGRYPMQCLGSYIHESLHHICFRSPVGTAVSALYHRGFQRAYDHLVLGKAAEFDNIHVLDDIVRVESLLHVMRPLAEGIALFGEFDAYPGQSKSMSSTFRNVAISFAEVVPDWEMLPVDKLLRKVLDHGRARPAMQRRKENLLMQGFSTKKGGYLPGYFLVKNLQFALMRHLKCEKLLDSEFYLNFIVHWFYGDFKLVAALTDYSKQLSPFSVRSMIEHDAVNAISVAFQRRFSALFTYLTADMIDRFDDLLASRSDIPWWETQLGTAPELAKTLEQRLLAEANDIIDFTRPGSEDQRLVRMLCHDNMLRRNFLCVGSFLEDIDILASGILTIPQTPPIYGTPLMALGESEKPGPWKGKATFDVLQSGRSGRVFYAVYAGPERVSIGALGGGFDEERDEIRHNNLSTAFCRRNKLLMRETIDLAIGGDSSSAIFREHYRTQSERTTAMMYKNWCGTLMTIVGPEASLSEEPGSLLVACDDDTMFLRTIAAMGCIGRPWIDNDDIARVCAAQGLAVDAFWARLSAVEQTHNLKLLYPLGRFFALTV